MCHLGAAFSVMTYWPERVSGMMILPLVSVTKLPRTVPSGAFTSKVAPESGVLVPVSTLLMISVVSVGVSGSSGVSDGVAEYRLKVDCRISVVGSVSHIYRCKVPYLLVSAHSA